MENKTKEKESKKVFAWWWLLIPVGLGAAWFLFPKSETGQESSSADLGAPALVSDFKICYEANTMVPDNCCTQDLAKVSIFESSNMVFASFKLPASTGANPSITGSVHWQSGEPFPTQPIQFSKKEAQGDACYVGKIQPVHGVLWSLHPFVLKLQVNGQPAGEKTFEIVR